MDRIQCNTILFLLIIQLLLLYVNLSQSKDNNNFPNYAIRVNKRDAQSGTPNINNTVAKEPLKCNGDAAICDLRYDQVTYPGTHNSASYNLEFDCNLTVRNCLDSVSVCSKQYAQCLMTYGMQCDAQTSACKQRNPQWLHWLCEGFNKTCRSSNALCTAWNAVCTNSDRVCNVWGNACEIDVPDWIITCFWENNPGYPVLRQLQDGIRLFDFDTCLLNNEHGVFCHGQNPARALGEELDTVFQVILDFMNSNPNEVITIEFGDTDGDPQILSNYIQSKLAQYFVNQTTGHSMMYSMSDPNKPWITLREMINNNTRIVVFFGRIYNNVQNRQPWIHYTYEWFTKSYRYTSNDMTPEQLTNSFNGYCATSDAVIRNDTQLYGKVRWQTIDDTVGILPTNIEEAIKMGKSPGPVCIKDLALGINFDVLKNIEAFCYPRFPYYFRVRVDHYWQSSLFEVVRKMNRQNVIKFLGNATSTNSANPT
ncbi:PLC-like phosphodiesterase [Rhizophagus irregularis]|uniref:PLC-like phosphodiesterase n=1 Tax=Rhizophagus irregularis TaxID=588596 RepID=A0A2N1NW10_9GLOM|nr:PLC-like phosphodiesterase [Rhizophagus irregularis]